MGSSFDAAIPVILAHEGGWCNHPNDLGKETNFGISMYIIEREGLTAKDLGVRDLTTPGCLKAMTVETAKTLYKRLFWDRYGYGRITDQRCSVKVFDCSVNCGPSRAHILAQRTANVLGKTLGVDGVFGDKTAEGVNGCNPDLFLKEYAKQMADYYRAIVTSRPNQVVFLNNWLHRAAWVG